MWLSTRGGRRLHAVRAGGGVAVCGQNGCTHFVRGRIWLWRRCSGCCSVLGIADGFGRPLREAHDA